MNKVADENAKVGQLTARVRLRTPLFLFSCGRVVAAFGGGAGRGEGKRARRERGGGLLKAG